MISARVATLQESLQEALGITAEDSVACHMLGLVHADRFGRRTHPAKPETQSPLEISNTTNSVSRTLQAHWTPSDQFTCPRCEESKCVRALVSHQSAVKLSPSGTHEQTGSCSYVRSISSPSKATTATMTTTRRPHFELGESDRSDFGLINRNP